MREKRSFDDVAFVEIVVEALAILFVGEQPQNAERITKAEAMRAIVQSLRSNTQNESSGSFESVDPSKNIRKHLTMLCILSLRKCLSLEKIGRDGLEVRDFFGGIFEHFISRSYCEEETPYS